MEQRITELHTYFEAQLAQCRQREQALLSDGRQDEATFEKIRANIFDIFRTILSVGEKSCKDRPEAMQDFFVKRLQQIPSSWRTAYEKASAHGDTVQMHIEEIKLQAVKEIEEAFKGIWEERHD